MINVKLQNDPIVISHATTSKGNQPKWYYDGYWYKADYFGYESLSEYVCSRILSFSNFKDFVEYELCNINFNGRTYRGCRSKSFNSKNLDIIPLEKFVRLLSMMGLATIMSKFNKVADRIEYISDFVIKNTNITDFNEYLSNLLFLDALFLNEDRHTNNIVLMRNVELNEWKMAPIFDMGAALFSDTRGDYPLSTDLEMCYETIKAKPFSEDFDEQLDEAERICISTIRFDFKGRTIGSIIDDIISDVPIYRDNTENDNSKGYYTLEEITRVREVIIRQFRKYSYAIK